MGKTKADYSMTGLSNFNISLELRLKLCVIIKSLFIRPELHDHMMNSFE